MHKQPAHTFELNCITCKNQLTSVTHTFIMKSHLSCKKIGIYIYN